MSKQSILFHLLTAISFASFAQDTLKVDMKTAEKMFLQNNLQLVSQQYQIDKAQADVITARLFTNPELSHENLFYNHETRRFLETSYATGQFNTEISKLFKLAGKRNKQIKLANTGVKMAEFEYFDLLRTLKYELHSNFYQTYYLQQSSKLYTDQIQSLEKLLVANEAQLKQGNVSPKDVIRIRSLVYSLKAEYNNLQNNIEELTGNLRVLLGSQANKVLNLVIDQKNDESIQLQAYTKLLDSAKTNRSDLKLSQTSIAYAQQNLRLQKAMAIPDVEVKLAYDLKGNYPEKYTGLGISIPLPLFDRNQGEIKKAKILVEEENNQFKLQETILENEVFKAYQNATRVEKLQQGLDQNFNADFEKLMKEVFKNFASRNMNLLEFLDFYESYKESTLQLNQLNYQLANAKEEINYVTGTPIFK